MIFSLGLWFWGNSGLFMKPWTPSFNLVNNILSSAPIWVRLPNIILHFWGLPSLEANHSTLGMFHFARHETTWHNTFDFSRIYVEMDSNKGFPTEVILIGKKYSWYKKIDFERVSLHCRSCFEIGHLTTQCSKGSRKNRKHRKYTWWVRSNDDPQRIVDNLHKTMKILLNPILIFIQLGYLKNHDKNILKI
jgi:hypothetical protein